VKESRQISSEVAGGGGEPAVTMKHKYYQRFAESTLEANAEAAFAIDSSNLLARHRICPHSNE
jgi:hypothetical protein